MKTKHILSLLLAALLLTLAACTPAAAPASAAPAAEAPKAEAPAAPAPVEPAPEAPADPAPEGAKKIRLTVTFEGVTEELEIHTDEETLGAALLKEGLISGSDSEYGLFVDTVNGHFADAAQGKYWVFTKGGEWVMTGVDTTPIEDGDSFEWSIFGETAADPAPEGAKTIRLTVTFEGVTEELEIHTDEETLGAALLKEGLISGSDSEYGLFVDTVNGHFADAAQGKYWVFTKGGEWVMTGVDTTPIEDGDSFEWSIYE